ncbi:MAG: hypothetical protein WC201_00330 [Bacilli bacterium]
MKKNFKLFSFGLLFAGFLFGVFNAGASNQNVNSIEVTKQTQEIVKGLPTPITDYNWDLVKTYGSDPFTIDNANEQIVCTNTAAFMNFLVTGDFDTRANNYSLRVDWVGTGTDNTVERQIGIVPWYLNSDNYIWVFAKQGPWYDGQTYHQFFFNAVIGGELAYKWNGSFVSGEEWSNTANSGDFDGGNIASAQPTPTTGGFLIFTKTETQVNGTACDQFNLKVNSETETTVDIFYRDTANVFYAENPKVGLYAYASPDVANDEIIYTSITFTKGTVGAFHNVSTNELAYFDAVDAVTCAEISSSPSAVLTSLETAYNNLTASEQTIVRAATFAKEKNYNVGDMYDYYVGLCGGTSSSSILFFKNNSGGAVIIIFTSMAIISLISLSIVLKKKHRKIIKK